MSPAYFDHNATTPLDPRVREAMLPWLGELFGNASSIHRWGQAARGAVEQARERVAALLGARPTEVVFTASASEGNNTVLATTGRLAGFRGRVVVSGMEHPSVRRGAELLAAAGMEVVSVPPDRQGVVTAEGLLSAVDGATRLVCLMLANNEVGTLQPVAEVAAECRQRQVPVLCDAAQAVGKVPVDVGLLAVDYLTLGAHKFHGPLGAAALWVRRGAPLEALVVGGGQERHRRAGTENVAAIVGLGRAAELAAGDLAARARKLAGLRDRFEGRIVEAAAPVVIHGRGVPRLPSTSQLSVLGAPGDALLIRLDLDGFAVASGAACASGTTQPSATLAAMGLPPAQLASALRVSFGMTNTEAEVDELVAALARHAAALRGAAPVAP